LATPYFAMYPTDFLADVGHLGNTELGIYWRLLLVYYRDGRPLPVDNDRLRRLAMAFSPEEFRCVEAVVSEFFVLSAEPDGTRVWRHRRADKEIEQAASRHEGAKRKASEAAKARWGKQKDAPGNAPSMPEAMLRQCHPEPEPNTSSLRSEVKSAGAHAPKARPPKVEQLGCPPSVDPQVWADWLSLRKAKRAPITPTVVESAAREAAKASMTLEAFLRVWVLRGSQGLMADWIKPQERAGAQPMSFRERDIEASRDLMRKVAPGLVRPAAAPPQRDFIDMPVPKFLE
jgi:uncharacterized protein YdaU (DUF1376 family)